MKSIWRGLSLAILLIGIVSYSQIQNGLKHSHAQDKVTELIDIEPVQPFVAKYVEYRVGPDGKRIISGRRTRYVNANGERRVEYYGPTLDETSLESSRQALVYIVDAEGVYVKGRGLNFREYVSPSADEKMQSYYRSARYLRDHREFVRKEDIAGVEVYVLRTEFKDTTSSHQWTEKGYSPKTGFNPLLTIMHFEDGSEIGLKLISLEFKEVPVDLNADIKALPLSPKHPKNQ